VSKGIPSNAISNAGEASSRQRMYGRCEKERGPVNARSGCAPYFSCHVSDELGFRRSDVSLGTASLKGCCRCAQEGRACQCRATSKTVAQNGFITKTEQEQEQQKSSAIRKDGVRLHKQPTATRDGKCFLSKSNLNHGTDTPVYAIQPKISCRIVGRACHGRLEYRLSWPLSG
jgi:hypothetical protein